MEYLISITKPLCHSNAEYYQNIKNILTFPEYIKLTKPNPYQIETVRTTNSKNKRSSDENSHRVKTSNASTTSVVQAKTKYFLGEKFHINNMSATKHSLVLAIHYIFATNIPTQELISSIESYNSDFFLQILSEFESKKLYSKFCYNLRPDSVDYGYGYFINSLKKKYINKQIIQLFADFLQINIVICRTSDNIFDTYYPSSKLNVNIPTIILSENKYIYSPMSIGDNSKHYIFKSNDRIVWKLLRLNIHNDIINYKRVANNNKKQTDYSNKTLLELQDLVKLKGISLEKPNKSGQKMIKKTKADLIKHLQ